MFQLLYICKIGGKVILRHAENEAENAKYGGLHQWNLSLHNKENSFVIWNANERYDICKILSEFATVELFPDQLEKLEDGWKYNKVVITKKKSIKLPEVKYKQQILDVVYQDIIQQNLHNALLNNNSMRVLGEYIEQCNNNTNIISKLCSVLNIKCLGIAGFGKYGQQLYEISRECTSEILIFDKKDVQYNNVLVEKYCSRNLSRCDVIVISSTKMYKDIEKELLNAGVQSEKIWGLEKFLYLAIQTTK